MLSLPSYICVHNVFHVSLLNKYIYDPRHIINWQDIKVVKLSLMIYVCYEVHDLMEIKLYYVCYVGRTRRRVSRSTMIILEQR